MKSKLILHGFLQFRYLLLIIILWFVVPKVSAQPDTVDLNLKVSLFEANKVHIIWHSNSNYNVEKYFVEKSINNIDWEVIDSIQTDSLIDIMIIPEQQLPDPFENVMHSTESGTSGFIKNEAIPDTSLLPILCYRITGILSNASTITTEYRMVYGVGLINQPPPSIQLTPGDCQLGDPIGWTLFTPVTTLVEYKTCCTQIKTKYFKTIITGYIPGSCTPQTSQNNCTANVMGANCTYMNSYDPCCGHIGSCYAYCDCGGVTPGTATWTPCDPVYGPTYTWIITSVTPSYSTMEITGMDVSCLNGTETYCVSGGISSWVWTVPPGQGIIIGPSNQNCVTVQWLTAGVHNLSVSAEVCSGITETANLDVTVLGPGSLSFTISTSNIICEGTAVCFSPTTSGTQNTSFEWFINGQSVALEFCPGIGSCGGQCGQYQQTFTGSPNGTQYTIDLVIYDINGNPILCNGSSQTITVYSNPVSTFQTPSGCLDINSLLDLCADQLPGSGVSYSWVATGATPSAGNSQCINNLSWPSAGGYDVTLTVSNPG